MLSAHLLVDVIMESISYLKPPKSKSVKHFLEVAGKPLCPSSNLLTPLHPRACWPIKHEESMCWHCQDGHQSVEEHAKFRILASTSMMIPENWTH